jgi:hypothetical protein
MSIQSRWLEVFPCTSHWYYHSFLCTVRFARKVIWYWSIPIFAIKEISPMWVLSCFWRELKTVKALLHLLYPQGFFPVRVILCPCSWLDRVKAFQHCSHTQGFSPLWIHSWARRETFITMLTSIGFFCNKSHCMSVQVTWVSQGFPTLLISTGLLSTSSIVTPFGT